MIRCRFHLVAAFLAACASNPAPPPVANMPTPNTQELLRDAAAIIHATPDAALVKYRDAWTRGAHDVRVAYGAACVAALSGHAEEAFVWLDRAVGLEAYAPTIAGDADLASLHGDPRFPALVARARSDAAARALAVGADLARSAPEAEGIDRAALDALMSEAAAGRSSAVVVLHNGKVVAESYFGGYTRRIEAMSATKSIVGLAIGLLLDERRIPSLDVPVWSFYPEWRQGRKERITVRMLLNHTSGLAAGRTSEEIYRSPDFVQLALAAELSDDPGAFFFYNNEAVNLLAGIVQRVSGQKLDDYLRTRLFEPLGIRDVTWSRDDAGNPHAMAGLQLHPIDFAKIGELLLEGGRWRGRRVIDPSYIEQSTRPSQPYDPTYGLLWWIDYETVTVGLPADTEAALSARGVPSALLDPMRPCFGGSMPLEAWAKATSAMKLEDYAVVFNALHAAKIQPKRVATGAYGYSARGYLGQTLLVIPSQRLVAVRMVDADQDLTNNMSADRFDALVCALVSRPRVVE